MDWTFHSMTPFILNIPRNFLWHGTYSCQDKKSHFSELRTSYQIEVDAWDVWTSDPGFIIKRSIVS